MKVLGQIPEIINKEVNPKYPFGAAIQNKTESVAGTPVAREVYNDVLMNLYKLLQITKVNPTNQEDNNDTQFQIIDALKKLVGNYDKLATIQMFSGEFFVNLDFSIIPDDFICLAISTDNYTNTQIKGSDNSPRIFESDGFLANEIILLRFSSTKITAYSFLNKSSSDIVYTNFGNPLSYNYSNLVEYKMDNYILRNNYSYIDIEQEIRQFTQDILLIVNYVFKLLGGYLIAVSKSGSPRFLKFYYRTSQDTFTEITTQGALNAPVNTNTPLIMFDGTNIWISNSSGSDITANVIDKYTFDIIALKLIFSQRITLANDFLKSQNTCIEGNNFYQLNSGNLYRYDFFGDVNLQFALINSNGRLFVLNGDIYYSTGEIARRLL